MIGSQTYHQNTVQNSLNIRSPFGMQISERSATFTTYTYRYGFNGQEGDDEVSGEGNSYTAEFWQYDSRLGRRFNLDPVYSNSKSNYCVLSNRPIIMIDPNGNSDYYSSKGKYLGSDGVEKSDIMIVTNRKVKRQMIKANRKALKTGDYVLYNAQVDKSSYIIIPPEHHREQMAKIMETHNPEGNIEVGGRGLKFSNGDYDHIRSKDGMPASNGEVAEINLYTVHKDDKQKANRADGYELEYSWHAHTLPITYYENDEGDFVTLGTILNQAGNSSKSGRRSTIIGGPSPSEDDLNNAQSSGRKINYIFLKNKKGGDGSVAVYNDNQQVLTRLKMKFFLETKAKCKPVKIEN